jgi:hypothetical protein
MGIVRTSNPDVPMRNGVIVSGWRNDWRGCSHGRHDAAHHQHTQITCSVHIEPGTTNCSCVMGWDACISGCQQAPSMREIKVKNT